MARTKGITTKQKETPEPLGRCIEYKHAHVAKSLAGNGFFFAVFRLNQPDERRVLCGDSSAAKHIIDEDEEQMTIQSDPQKRGKRTRGVKVTKQADYSHLSHGGYTMNPPEDCRYKCKFDKEAPWWVENVLCHGSCKVNEKCETFKQLMSGQKLRIKLMSTNRLDQVCPFCKAEIESSTEHGVNVTYRCGTTGDRLSQAYEQGSCKKPKPKEKKRRTK